MGNGDHNDSMQNIELEYGLQDTECAALNPLITSVALL